MPADPSALPQKARLTVSALAGGFAGLLLGALYLGYQAYAGWHFDCGELLSDECALQTNAMRELAQMQTLAAVALALASAAMLLLLRLKLRGGDQ